MHENQKLMEIHFNNITQKLDSMYQSQQSLYQIKEMTDQFEVEKLQLKQRLDVQIAENVNLKQKCSVKFA